MAINLTKKQVELLNFIEVFIEEAGYSPTYREIARGLGYKSIATVAKHIDNLVILGKLTKSDGGEARSVSIKKQITELTGDEKAVHDFLVKKRGFYAENNQIEQARKIDDVIIALWY